MAQDAIDVFVNVDRWSDEGEFDDRLPEDDASSSSDDEGDCFPTEESGAFEDELNTKSDIYDNFRVLGSDFDWDKYGSMNELRDQAERLQEETKAKDVLIQSQTDTIAALRQELTTVLSQDVHETAKDIVQKNRSLRLALTKATGNNARLNAQVNQLREIIDSNHEKPTAVSSMHQTDVERECREWKAKFLTKSARLSSCSSQVSHLKSEIVALKRVIKAEVGGEGCIEKVLSGKSNWRGRAEEIARLTLKLNRERNRPGVEGSPPRKATVCNALERRKGEIERKLKEKVAGRDEMAKDLEAVKQQNRTLKTKNDAIMARNRTLEEQVVNMKGKLHVVIEQSANDDKLIESLRVQLSKLSLANEQIPFMKTEIASLKAAVSNQNERIIDQDALKMQLISSERELDGLKSKQVEIVEGLFDDWDRDVLQKRIEELGIENSDLIRTLHLSQQAYSNLENRCKIHNDSNGTERMANLKPGRARMAPEPPVGVSAPNSELIQSLQKQKSRVEEELAISRQLTKDAHRRYQNNIDALNRKVKIMAEQVNITRNFVIA